MTADTALIKRALEQAKEQFEWLRDERGIQMTNTRELLTRAIAEAELLQMERSRRNLVRDSAAKAAIQEAEKL